MPNSPRSIINYSKEAVTLVEQSRGEENPMTPVRRRFLFGASLLIHTVAYVLRGVLVGITKVKSLKK